MDIFQVNELAVWHIHDHLLRCSVSPRAVRAPRGSRKFSTLEHRFPPQPRDQSLVKFQTITEDKFITRPNACKACVKKVLMQRRETSIHV